MVSSVHHNISADSFAMWMLYQSPLFRRTIALDEPNGKVKVLSTIAMINDIVKQVGGEYVNSYTLIKGDLDPHSYQLVKGDDETLSFADLIFFNGLGLEHGPSLQKFLLTSSKSIGLGDAILREHPEVILMHAGQVDPHIWMAMDIWAETIPIIVKGLSDKDPAHVDAYRKNGEKMLRRDVERRSRNPKRALEHPRIPTLPSHES